MSADVWSNVPGPWDAAISGALLVAVGSSDEYGFYRFATEEFEAAQISGTSDFPGVLTGGRDHPADISVARGCVVEHDPERAVALMLGLGDSRILGVGQDEDGLLVEVETSLDVDKVCCPTCHGSVVLDGTEELEQTWPPSFGRPTAIVWMLRRLRCEDGACPVETFVEDVPQVRPA